MHKYLTTHLLILLLGLLVLSPLQAAESAQQTDAAQQEPPAASLSATADLLKLQKQLDSLRQQVSATTDDSTLADINNLLQDLADSTDTLTAALLAERGKVQAKLDVLGPEPKDGAMAETPEMAKQRTSLDALKSKLDIQIEQAKALKTSLVDLSVLIIEMRRTALKTQLVRNSGSILNPRFWHPLSSPKPDDVSRVQLFVQQLSATASIAWQPEWRTGTLVLLFMALALATVGRRLLDKLIIWISTHWLPDGSLKRSFVAAALTLATALTIAIAANCLEAAFIRHGESSQDVLNFTTMLVKLSTFCAIFAGLGQAFLSSKRPSWRLPFISDSAALAMKPFPLIIAGLLFIFSMFDQLNNIIGMSISMMTLTNGLLALSISLAVLAIAIRINRFRRKRLPQDKPPEIQHSMLSGFIQLGINLTALTILLCLITGYISLAKFLAYELVWAWMVLSFLYLMIKLLSDSCDSIFSPTSASGQQIKQSLNLEDRYLAQAATLLSAVGKVLLYLLALVALFNGTFGATTPLALLQNAFEYWGGEGLEKLNIVPAQVLNAIFVLVVGLYLLRSARRWLEFVFLPQTNMDLGLRTSVVTLFSNIGYILIIMLTLSTMGIQWNRLAWIVSALSVGVGFGLQEIVKNFFSGIILLTERPVKVGDLITINGIEGNIRRINVRATEIQQSDQSTVIVPNSQFISQNVRNITLGNPHGVATIALTFPLDIDPEQVRTLLLDVYTNNEAILDNPPPSVTFSQLLPTGIVLSVSGHVRSPRAISNTKSNLLFDILKALRAANISLFIPQKMILENAGDRENMSENIDPAQ